MRSTAAAAAGLAAGGGFPYILRRLGPPNVLVIVLDTLRADRMGYGGCSRGLTPTMDSLAESGVSFSDVVTASSWTKTSVASIMSGLHPFVHRVLAPGNPLLPKVPSLGKILYREGWLTFSLQTNPWLGVEGHGFGRGYDFFRFLSVNKDKGNRVHVPVEKGQQYVDGRHVVAFMETLAGALADSPKPFLGYLHFMDVHGPYLPPAPYDALFSKPGELVPDDIQLAADIEGPAKEPGLPSEAQRRRCCDLYDGSVRYADELVSRIVRILQKHKILNQTMVLITSDHGEEFWEHGQLGHTKTLYGEVLQVPLLMAGGGVPRGMEVAQRVRQVDILPTLLEMVGVRTDNEFDGESVLGLIEGAPQRKRDTYNVAYLGKVHPVPKRSLSTLAPHAKVIVTEHEDGKDYELYDLRKDPGELADLAANDPSLAMKLAGELDEMEAAAAERACEQENAIIPADVQQQLRSLGYLN